MPRVPFDDLPGHGRLWVFPASRTLATEEVEPLLNEVDDFLAGWAAHGAPLRSARDLVEDRFLLVGVDVDAEAPSGCSIDALVNRLGSVGEDLGVTLIDHTPVWYRAGDDIATASRADFRARVAEGELVPSVHVFDTTLTRIEQAREGRLERPATETWHGRAFFKDHVGA